MLLLHFAVKRILEDGFFLEFVQTVKAGVSSILFFYYYYYYSSQRGYSLFKMLKTLLCLYALNIFPV